MARTGLVPVSVEGIEFDALIEETKTLSATVPAYPVEDGYPVSDTIVLEPLTISMTLFVSNTPVTWLYRHGSSMSRVKEICDQIENLWMQRSLVKIVTTDAIYTDMGITSLAIKKARDIGYAREITLTAQKIRTTARKTAEIPSYLLKSGETNASAGTAVVSSTSNRASGSGTAAGSAGSGNGGTSGTSGSGASSGASSGNSTAAAKKSASVLYGVASGLGFI